VGRRAGGLWRTSQQLDFESKFRSVDIVPRQLNPLQTIWADPAEVTAGGFAGQSGRTSEPALLNVSRELPGA